MSQIDAKSCTLRLAAHGEVEPCPRERCSLWEPGGAVVAGGCVIDRLGIDVRQTALAAYLLDTRECLDDAKRQAEAEAAHLQFGRRLGRDV